MKCKKKTKIYHKIKFEDCLNQISIEINKRRSKWNLTALAWMDFDDVAQIIRAHIYAKWHLYNQARPLGPWLNAVISSQIKNIVRNEYGNYSRPCLRCDAAEGEDLCRIYTKQCVNCPLFAAWEKTKKRAHDIKLPVSLEFHTQEVHSMMQDNFDIDASAKNLHARMQQILKPIEWRIYRMLYIRHMTDEDVADAMGYTTSEKNRSPGYKRIKNIKKIIVAKVKKVLSNGEIDII